MRKKATLPSAIAFIVALVGILSFFVPYASLQDEDHRDSLNEFGEMEVVDDVDMTLSDMVDPSLFTPDQDLCSRRGFNLERRRGGLYRRRDLWSDWSLCSFGGALCTCQKANSDAA